MENTLLKSAILVLGMAVSSAHAATVSLNFSGNGDSAEFIYNTVLINDGGFEYYDSSFDAANITFNGITTSYEASTNALVRLGVSESEGYLVLKEGVVASPFITPAAEDVVTHVLFNGQQFINDDGDVFTQFNSDLRGDVRTIGANYEISADAGAFFAYDNVYMAGLEFNTLTVTTTVSAVPVPTAAWLFISGIIGLVGFSRRRSQ